VPIEERLLEEKRHHTGTSHSRICIDIDQDSSSQAIDAYGILVCRLQVERTNYHGPELSTAIQRRNWRLTTRNPKPDGIFGKDRASVTAGGFDSLQFGVRGFSWPHIVAAHGKAADWGGQRERPRP
jgi:hypothetical protein